MEWKNKILVNSLKFQKSGKSITSVVKKIGEKGEKYKTTLIIKERG